MLTLVTGPVRSGKSRFAQHLATQTGLPVTYVATAQHDLSDPEWTARLMRHVESRPRHWKLIETAGIPISEQQDYFARACLEECLLIDSLGTWIAHAMSNDAQSESVRIAEQLEQQALCFADSLLACRAQVIAVGEQVGWDVVPASSCARVFRDVLGRMQQRLATHGAQAYLVAAGHAIDLRKTGEIIPE